jgi:hypothetical protein
MKRRFSWPLVAVIVLLSMALLAVSASASQPATPPDKSNSYEPWQEGEILRTTMAPMAGKNVTVNATCSSGTIMPEHEARAYTAAGGQGTDMGGCTIPVGGNTCTFQTDTSYCSATGPFYVRNLLTMEDSSPKACNPVPIIVAFSVPCQNPSPEVGTVSGEIGPVPVPIEQTRVMTVTIMDDQDPSQPGPLGTLIDVSSDLPVTGLPVTDATAILLGDGRVGVEVDVTFHAAVTHTLVFTAGEDVTGVIEVRPKAFESVTLVVTDDPGDNDGVLEAGETLSATVVVTLEGGIPCQQCRVTFSADPAAPVVWQPDWCLTDEIGRCSTRVVAMTSGDFVFTADSGDHAQATVAITVPTAVTLVGLEGWWEPGVGVVISWTTSTEVDTVGFNIYRSTAPDDPAPELVTPELIPSESPGSPVGASYNWTDGAVQPGVTYFYWLEDVDVHGVTGRHGPVVVAVGPFRVFLPLAVRSQGK